MTSPAPEPTPPSAGDGERAVDGFSWLLVDRLGDDPRPEGDPMPRLVAPGWPALARQMGVWRGTFRRHDAAGCLLDSLASTVVRGLETTGEPRDGRLPVQSGRLSGWAMDVPDAPGTTVLVMERRDGSNLQVREISQPLEGGRRRVRGDPAIQGEGLVGRAHLEERQSSADWRAWGPAPMESDG